MAGTSTTTGTDRARGKQGTTTSGSSSARSSGVCGMQRSSYATMTISPARSPHVGHYGSRSSRRSRPDPKLSEGASRRRCQLAEIDVGVRQPGRVDGAPGPDQGVDGVA
jgi:hypothetical protein